MLLLALTSCAAPAGSGATPTPSASSSQPVGSTDPTGAVSPSTPDASEGEHTVAIPGPLKGRLWQPDLLMVGAEALPADLITRIAALAEVTSTEQLSVGQMAVENGVITVAAVDPATYRRYTPLGSARTRAVWTRVAQGQLALTPHVARTLGERSGSLNLGNETDAPSLQIGALAPQIPRIDAVVNTAWGADLGLPAGNALLVSTGLASPQSVQPEIQQLVGPGMSVQILGPDPDLSVQQPAYLTGGSVAAAVGSFTYQILPHGRIAPDPAWVAANIRTEQVPILGQVTCHRVMLPQLRGALAQIVAEGLADKIHPDDYAGCYYPRFIAGTTQLSLHSFGIAVDLNVSENQRGTAGSMDPRVVEIFRSWGFTWGGSWHYTDPMHFELSALVAFP